MENPASAEAMPRRRLALPWIIGGIVALVMLLLIGAAGSVIWLGVDTFNEQALTAVRADPAIVDALGRVTDIKLDFYATGDADGADEFVYRVTGERASGRLLGRFVTVDAETEDLRDGTLTLDDGRKIAIGTVLRRD